MLRFIFSGGPPQFHTRNLFLFIASFNLTFSSRLSTRPIENVLIELNLGEGAHAIKCTASRESGGLGRGLSSLETGMSASSTASWAFDSRKKVGIRCFLRLSGVCSHSTFVGSGPCTMKVRVRAYNTFSQFRSFDGKSRMYLRQPIGVYRAHSMRRKFLLSS